MPSIKDQSTVEAVARAFTSNGRNKERALKTVGYSDNYAEHRAGCVLDNVGVKQAIARIDVKIEETSEITRKTQLADLEEAKQMARDLKMPAAFVSACREQDNILGLIRDKAPNEEAQAAIRERMTDEERKYRLAWEKQRTAEESAFDPLYPRIKENTG